MRRVFDVRVGKLITNGVLAQASASIGKERLMGESLGRFIAGLLRVLLAPIKGLVGLLVGLVRGLITGLAKIFT
jgi:hypothetical protein